MPDDPSKGARIMSFVTPGTIAFVTGANRGIGRALVDALLARGAAKIYAGARRLDTLAPLVAAGRGRVVPVQLDVTRPDEVRAASALASDLTLLVNNAGVVAKFGAPFADPGWLDAGRTEYEVNVLGPLAVTQAFAPILARNGGGTVANISSVAGLVAFDILTSYSASKAALHSITQATRASLKGQGTYVAGIYPGPVDTDMAKAIEMEKATPAEAAEAILDGLEAGDEEIFPDPLSRQAGPLYLASPKALERQQLEAGVPVGQ
jgi:NAD(P)-dependent dehydrogenase (short-subunit alcohol dehydrogenase family)